MGRGGEKAVTDTNNTSEKAEVLLDGTLYDVSNMKVCMFVYMYTCTQPFILPTLCRENLFYMFLHPIILSFIGIVFIYMYIHIHICTHSILVDLLSSSTLVTASTPHRHSTTSICDQRRYVMSCHATWPRNPYLCSWFVF